ncbi:MAG: hypothetical protein AAB739_01165 [Patescibacteria group bacterium]
MQKNKQIFFSDVTKVKHFLLGAGLVLTLIASTSFAQTILPSGEAMLPCAPGQMPAPGKACMPNGAVPTNLESGPTTGTPQQPSQPSPPSQPSGQPPFSAQAIEGAIASGQLTADTSIPCPPLGGFAKASDCLNAAKGQTSGLQKPAAEETAPTVNQKVDKSKLSSAKNPVATLAKTGLKNVDKLLNTLSKKFNKAKSKTKKIAVVRSIAKNFMKLCKKYAPSAQDEEFGDEESFTCDEFVADLSEPIAAAFKSKDADLSFELTYDALNVNFKELFNSLIQQ